MSEIYRRISVRMWGDADFRALSGPQPNAQSLWQYLLTGPHTTPIPGLFAATQEGLAASLKWPLKGFQKALAELVDAKKPFLEADWEAGVVWIRGAIKHNEPANPKIVMHWRVAFQLIPESSLKAKAASFLREYGERRGKGFPAAFDHVFGFGASDPPDDTGNGFADHSGDGLGNGFADGHVNGTPNREQQQKQKQKRERARARDRDAEPFGPELAPADPPGPLDADEHERARGLVRREFAARYHAAEGTFWTRAGDPALDTLARWYLSLPEPRERALKRTLDAFFSDQWVRSKHFPVDHLARHPEKYRDPRSPPPAPAKTAPADDDDDPRNPTIPLHTITSFK